MGTRVLLGLGSNLGDRQRHLDGALAALAATPGVTVRAVSAYRETPPVGGPSGQGAYLNAAAALETNLGPSELLARCFEIEANAGRVRSVHWGERSLDVDLLLHGNQVIALPTLTVPHPRLTVRRFVLRAASGNRIGGHRTRDGVEHRGIARKPGPAAKLRHSGG